MEIISTVLYGILGAILLIVSAFGVWTFTSIIVMVIVGSIMFPRSMSYSYEREQRQKELEKKKTEEEKQGAVRS